MSYYRFLTKDDTDEFIKEWAALVHSDVIAEVFPGGERGQKIPIEEQAKLKEAAKVRLELLGNKRKLIVESITYTPDGPGRSGVRITMLMYYRK